VHADDPAWNACRLVDRPVSGGINRRARFRRAIGDDRPVPGKLTPRMDPVDCRSSGGVVTFIAMLASQVVRAGARLPVLPEGNPNFLSF
jgi:hypothetical protein